MLHLNDKPLADEEDENSDGQLPLSGISAEEAIVEERSLVPDEETGLTPVGSGNNRKSFAELFWEVFILLKYQLPNAEEDKHKCYMFELATPQNRVLIHHKMPHLYLHGVRDLISLKEEIPDLYCKKFGWQLTPMEVISGGKDEFERIVLQKVNTLDGLFCEGYVICDAQFNRFKLKCPSYVNMALLHNRDGNEWKRLVAIVQVNEGSEFLAYFPQHTDLYNQIQSRYQILIDTLQMIHDKYKTVDTKEMARIAKESIPEWIRGPLFIRRKSNEDFKTYFAHPNRYNLLCTLLNPEKSIPTIPNLDALPAALISADTPILAATPSSAPLTSLPTTLPS